MQRCAQRNAGDALWHGCMSGPRLRSGLERNARIFSSIDSSPDISRALEQPCADQRRQFVSPHMTGKFMSKQAFWRGVIPAITTPFREDGSIDHEFLARHAVQMIDAGCTAI